MKRAALYLRVSTLDQHPETQLYDLRQMAQQRGYLIVEEVYRQDKWRQSEESWTRCLDARCPPWTVRCRPGLGF